MTSVRVVLASTNPGKLTELRRILAGLAVDLVDAATIGLGDVEETGSTFEENACIKARAAARDSGHIALGDDSGFEVDALGGAPGVWSARYAGPERDDAANLAKVLAETADATERSARFVCVAALATPDGRAWTTRGVMEGTIATEPRGKGGFGYDPIMVPDGRTKTIAELPPEEKDAISHRGKAFRALRPAVSALLDGDDPADAGAAPAT